MTKNSTLVVSLDGVAPRHITRASMPSLTRLALDGAACWSSSTVEPPLTLPAHTSLFHGVAPATHGVLDNSPVTPAGSSSLMAECRRHGLSTAAVHCWSPFSCMFEPGSLTQRVEWDAGYDPADDVRTVRAACDLLEAREHDVVFAYIAEADLVGHEHGWDSSEYVESLGRVDQALGLLVAAAPLDANVIVTTDHGGLAKNHAEPVDAVMETFVVARSSSLQPMSMWEAASILDVAPTVAQLCGIEPPDAWEGRSLVGRERPWIDVLTALLESMASVSYGEDLDMLQHSLQSAALALNDGASTSLVVAALLHDVGHLLGDAGRWGLASHAEEAARFIQALLPESIVDPIRLHVDAKRHLVATDPSYVEQLSRASIETLSQQGGPFDDDEARRFVATPRSGDALALRRWDDAGKVAELHIDELEVYTSLLDQVLAAQTVSARWARDACRCPECRDERNDQHLLDASDLEGWSVERADHDANTATVWLSRADSEVHRCEIPAVEKPGSGREVWGAGLDIEWRAPVDTEAIAVDVATRGISFVGGVPATSGAVLDIARSLGFVRETNYGVLFDVRAEPDPNNLAYTSLGLPLHTDNPYRNPCPGVQLLHCLEAPPEGGASVFADGFSAVGRLSTADVEALSTHHVTFRFHDDEVDLSTSRPIVEMVDGEVTAVNVNHRSMEAPTGGGAGRFYDAYASFVSVLSDDDSTVELTLRPGELVVFDNRRVVHGRTAFDNTARRHLQGCYIDMDALRSRAAKAASASPADVEHRAGDVAGLV